MTFFSGWLTAELAPHLLALDVVDAADQVRRRRYRTRGGRIDLGLTAASLAGLIILVRRGQRAGIDAHHVLDSALPASDPPRPTPWRRLVNPFRMGHPDVTRVADIQYAPGGKRHRLDVYHRADLPAEAPVLFQIHGGGWTVGDKHQQGVPLMMDMAALGWVCVAPNYPLSPKAVLAGPPGRPQARAGLGSRAHRRVRRRPDIRRGHRWVGGRALVGDARPHAERGEVPAWIRGRRYQRSGLCAALRRLRHRQRDDSKPVEARLRAIARIMFKRDWRGDRTVFEEASPICLVRADAPPFFVIHGRDDTLVPVGEARAFVERLRAVSTSPVVYAEVHGAQHAFDLFPSVRSAHIVGAVERFLLWARSENRMTRRDGADAVSSPDGAGNMSASGTPS